ncbi:MAG: J domain-containing protein [Abditibacteriota bacterium]|nr:J domain-containing protein [Abditibacteriota bacterium]
MSIVKLSEPDTAEYVGLLMQRDGLLKEAESCRIAYYRKFGSLIIKNYRAKLECIRRKKIIAFLQAALNRGEKADETELMAYIQKELEVYRQHLETLISDKKAADNAVVSPAEDVFLSKKIYRRLAKRLHPDMCPETAADPQLMELWLRITEAYKANDSKALEELEILAGAVLDSMGKESLQISVPNIRDRITALRAEIEEIVTTEPWTLQYITEDRDEADKKTRELTKETEEFVRYAEELDGVIYRLKEQGEL